MTQYTLDDLRAFAAYEGRDPTAMLAADVARAGLARVTELEEALRAAITIAAGDRKLAYDLGRRAALAAEKGDEHG